MSAAISPIKPAPERGGSTSSGGGAAAVRHHHHLQRPQPAPIVTAAKLGALTTSEDKAQTAKNNALAARMVELGESVVSIHDSMLINIKAKLAQLTQRLNESTASAAACEEQYTWSRPCDWDFEKICARYKHQLTVPEIAALATLGEYQSAAPRMALQELSTAPVSKRTLSAKRSELQPTDQHSAQPVTASVLELYEYLHADVLGHARDELSRTDAGIARLMAAITYHQDASDEALQQCDTATAETHQRAIIDAYLELLEILNQRLRQLAHTGSDTRSFRAQAQGAIDEARRVFDEFASYSRRLQDAVTSDLQRSHDSKQQEEAAHRDASQTHRLFVKTTQDNLAANGQEQIECVEQIVQLVERLKILAKDRLQALDDAAREKQREELRLANYREFCVVQANFVRHLEAIKDQADNYCFTSDGLGEYLRTMEQRIAGKDVEGALVDLTLAEARSYLTRYRGYVHAAGGLVTKKELLLETLARQHRLAQLQRDTAVESLDPDVAVYASRQREIDGKVERVTADVAKLRAEMDACAAGFAVAENLLIAHGVPYEHPHAERGEQAAGSKERYVNRALAFINSEENIVERSREALRKTLHLLHQERHDLRAARASSSLPLPPKDGAEHGDSGGRQSWSRDSDVLN